MAWMRSFDELLAPYFSSMCAVIQVATPQKREAKDVMSMHGTVEAMSEHGATDYAQVRGLKSDR
jgi:hypothetical protein